MESRLALCLSAPLDMDSSFAINSRDAISRRSRGMTDLTYRLDDFGRRLDVHEHAELRARARPEMKPEPAPVAPPTPTLPPPVGARRQMPPPPRREIDWSM